MVQNSPFARKLSAYLELSGPDLAALSDVYDRRRKFPAGQDLISQGQENSSAFILMKGWACSYVLLEDGSRQIIAFHIAGDTLGLRSILFRGSDHNVEAITNIEASEVLISDLASAFGRSTEMATAILWSASRDVSALVANLVGLGRRSAAERIAHCLLELATRLHEVDLCDMHSFDCPLSQYQLADALGLSAVHVNRVLRELHESGLMTFQKRRVTLDDFDGLVAFAQFDRTYLKDTLPKNRFPSPKSNHSVIRPLQYQAR